MSELPAVKESIEPVLSSFTYAEGLKCSDFDPDLDEVAAWTIGGWVAGKVLAKTGLIALLLKNIKLILLGFAAAGTAIWKWYKRKTLPECEPRRHAQRIVRDPTSMRSNVHTARCCAVFIAISLIMPVAQADFCRTPPMPQTKNLLY